MNTLARNKVLLSIIGILLITNIVLLVLFLRVDRSGHKEEKRIGFTERLRKEVGFTPQQMQVFEPKKKAFWNRMRKRFDEIKDTKEDFYSQIYNPSIADSVIEAKAQTIGQQQKELDLQVIRHFKEVRTLCTVEQLPKFDSLVPSIIDRMTARAQKK